MSHRGETPNWACKPTAFPVTSSTIFFICRPDQKICSLHILSFCVKDMYVSGAFSTRRDQRFWQTNISVLPLLAGGVLLWHSNEIGYPVPCASLASRSLERQIQSKIVGSTGSIKEWSHSEVHSWVGLLVHQNFIKTGLNANNNE